MTDYRRNRVPGGTYFFTVNLADRRNDLLTRHIELLRASVKKARAIKPFHIDGRVVLPEHMHCIWTLPNHDTDFSSRWRIIKTEFSKHTPPGETISSSRATKGERGIWQRRFWEHTIRDDTDYAAHLDYIHFNPVKHQLVTHAAQWTYSSFHRCAAKGLHPPDWSATKYDPTNPASRRMGERSATHHRAE
jgi:putative transposase